MQKQLQRLIAAALLTAVTLTGCGTDPVSSTGAADRTETTSAAEETAATENTDPQDTTAAAEHTTEYAETTTAAAVTDEVITDIFDVRTLFEDGTEAAISCSGFVCGIPEGLELYAEATDSGELLTTLENRSAVEVLGIAVTGDLWNWSDRWLHIKADGQEGYVLADYIAAQCSTPASELSEAERGALGVLMYYQSMNLYLMFQREGGTIADGTTGEYDEIGFDRLAPDGITFAQLMDAFHEYFTDDYDDRFDECYRESDNALWVISGYGDNIALDYTEIYMMTEQKTDRLLFDTQAHWYPEFTDTEVEFYPFEIVYTDGVWKTAVMTELY